MSAWTLSPVEDCGWSARSAHFESAMEIPESANDLNDFESLVGGKAARARRYVLRLYVAGSTPRSVRAIQSIRKVCAEHLAGRYDLQIIDIHQQPSLVKDGQIIAAPTLVRELPPPLRKYIGDLSDPERVLLRLDITPSIRQSQSRGISRD